MVCENADRPGRLAKNFLTEPVVTPMKAILFKPVWVSSRFYFSFLCKQLSSREPPGFQTLPWLHLVLLSVCTKPKWRSLYPEFIACHTGKVLKFW